MTLYRSQLKIGALFENRYSIISRLGEGGMGAVFLANDHKLAGKQWAIKESLWHASQPQGFADEAAMLVKLNHPFLPKIIDFYPPDSQGFSYLVMDYINGQTLQNLFEARKSLTVELVIRYAKQLCQVFDYLHKFKPKSIIFRDLKPSNVMIDQQNNVCLIDFGIARSYTFERSSDTVQLGTVGFAAPEQYELQQTDARSDLYTLGALLFYLLNNGQHYSFQAKQLQKLTERIPEKLIWIITKLLKINPDERFQEASHVLAELEQIYEVSPVELPPKKVVNYPLSSIPRKLIIVGSLYPGAGSTFVSLALARVLNHYAVPHALVESVHNQPELFTLFYGEKHAPQGYRYSADKVYSATGEKSPIWNKDYTELHPLPPNGFNQAWNKELSYKLLYFIDQPVVIIDVSHHWEDPTVMELCRQANEILVVAAPSLAKLNSPRVHTQVEIIKELQDAGLSIHCVANRVIAFPAQKEWLSTLPFRTMCVMPEFDYASILLSEWGGKLFADQEESIQIITKCMKSLCTKIVPLDFQAPSKYIKKHALTRWFK
ncbi:protein kinase domain-containing protein [Paenibacillus psychroresistens]|uniref:protein kinase domain-containing protein n=1 Tax=Paenibacillus psychroresistens TaxID=1778678 RepID=UPI0013919ABE|nr:protein kinase [Paenibacillus psychroresistens]